MTRGPRIVVLGATGYTGRLTVEALLRCGRRPVLAGRSVARLAAVADQVGAHLDVVEADVLRPASVRELVERGDVLVSTVGPFTRLGGSAVEAAVAKRAAYVDSNGEPPFTRNVFERHGPEAARAGVPLLTAFGWECVAGNLAGALAVHDAGEGATRVDTGYFYTAATRFSRGTRASFAEAMVLPSFAYRDGRICTVRGAERYRTMPVYGRQRPAVSFGASEHLSLPRVFPQLREVNAYLGWFGGLSPRLARALHVMSPAAFGALSVPAIRSVARAAASVLGTRSGEGPTAESRAGAGVHVVGIAYDRSGRRRAEVHLRGIEGYELTAALLAWAATRVAAGGVRGAGALGPIEAFGLEALESGCRAAGLARVG